MFLLQYVQPGLAGLMDGSVSTLAPLFAAAFATHNTWETFLVGLIGGGGHFHGLCGSALRRRLAHRARGAAGARRRVWGDDRDRRGWAHPAPSPFPFFGPHRCRPPPGRRRGRGPLPTPPTPFWHRPPPGRRFT